MLKKFAIVISILATLGGGATSIISGMESDVSDIKTEFYEDDSDSYTSEEKDWIWSQAWSVVESDLSDLDFGGSSYDK